MEYGQIPSIILNCTDPQLRSIGISTFSCNGSTDKETLDIIRRIVQHNKNEERKKNVNVNNTQDEINFTNKFKIWFCESGGLFHEPERKRHRTEATTTTTTSN